MILASYNPPASRHVIQMYDNECLDKRGRRGGRYRNTFRVTLLGIRIGKGGNPIVCGPGANEQVKGGFGIRAGVVISARENW